MNFTGVLFGINVDVETDYDDGDIIIESVQVNGEELELDDVVINGKEAYDILTEQAIKANEDEAREYFLEMQDEYE